MEAQISLLGVSSTCTLSPKTRISQSLTTSYSPFSSVKIRATKSIAFKTRFSVHSCTPSTNPRLESTVCIDKLQREIVEDSPDELYRKVRRKKLAVFVSGGGSNFKSLHEGSVNGLVHGDISVLVTNKPDCGGAEFARNKGIPVILFPKAKDGTGLSSKDLVATLKAYEIDFILLAGYLKRIPLELIKGYPRSILNIHPSLLPAFGGKGYYGMKVHQAVVASGARYSGATIHFVDEEYDTGRILSQRIVPVKANDTAEDLAARVLHEEHKVYVEVANALCEERVFWREDGVPIIQTKESCFNFRVCFYVREACRLPVLKLFRNFIEMMMLVHRNRIGAFSGATLPFMDLVRRQQWFLIGLRILTVGPNLAEDRLLSYVVPRSRFSLKRIDI